MDAFSYLSVLLSIIIGLAMTQVLMGYRGLLLSRSRVKLYAPTLVWSGLILVFAVQSWWASFGLSDDEAWTFLDFGLVLLQTALLYMTAGVVLPDIPPGETVDLREHYYREAPAFFAFIVAMLAVSLLKDVALEGELPERSNVIFHLAFGALSVAAIFVRRPIFHQALAVVATLGTVTYIGLLFFRLEV